MLLSSRASSHIQVRNPASPTLPHAYLQGARDFGRHRSTIGMAVSKQADRDVSGIGCHLDSVLNSTRLHSSSDFSGLWGSNADLYFGKLSV